MSVGAHRPGLSCTASSRLRLAAVALAALTVVLLPSITTRDVQGAASTNAQTQVDHKVIFVLGINTSANCTHTDGYADSVSRLAGAARNLGLVGSRDLAGLSYSGLYCQRPVDSGDPDLGLMPAYVRGDTCGSVPDRAAELDRLIGLRWPQASHPNARFTVIGHSLGGVIAAYWARFTPHLSRLNAVVTLDSPLLGAGPDWFGLLGQAGIAFWGDCEVKDTFDQVFVDLLSGSQVIGRVGEAPGAVTGTGSGRKFVVIQNPWDNQVFRVEADELAKFEDGLPEIYDLARPCGPLISAGGVVWTPEAHGCVWAHGETEAIVKKLLTPAFLPTPTPTPTTGAPAPPAPGLTTPRSQLMKRSRTGRS